MTRQYATPAAFKQALEQQLRTQAAGDGIELARLRQLLVFDRFLARVTAVFGDRVVLKGGLVVELRLSRARTTRDVDLRLVGNPEEVLAKLQEAGRLDFGDFLRFEVRDDPRHPEIEAEGMQYQGRRFRAQAMLAAKVYGSSFGVDVAFAESMTGVVEEIPGNEILAFAGVQPASIRIYPLETHIAEKLHAFTMPRSRPNSRVKDLPDIALLAMVRSLEAVALQTAIETTFTARGTHDVPGALPYPPDAWAPVYARIARIDQLRWVTLEDVHQAAAAFLNPILSGCGGRWHPGKWEWRHDSVELEA